MSYNRYRKRDKSEIDRKYEIGLGRVENYDSADISENVIHHVRDYLYTPLYLDITKDRKGSYGVVKFLEAGHTMFITSLCKISGTNKVVYDTLCGSLVYDKPTDKTDIKECPINFKVLGNYDTSPIFIDATITVTVYLERPASGGPEQIVTYVGIGMEGLQPFGKHNVRAIGTNLHDYTLGAVDYVDSTDPYDISRPNFLAQWIFRLSDQIKRDLLAVPLYNNVLHEYVYSENGENYQSGAVDAATINGVPFCGVYGLTVDGKDARHITVKAYHKGSSRNDAGEHQWAVLKSYPYLKYDKANTKYKTANDLSQENSLSDKGGLCYLSDFDDREDQTMEEFLDTLGYWLSDDKKEENLTVSSVITVGILRRFWKLLKPLLDVSIYNLSIEIKTLKEWHKNDIITINNYITELQNNIKILADKIGNVDVPDVTPEEPVIPDPTDPVEPNEVSRHVDLTLSKSRFIFSSPDGQVSDTVNPTGKIYQHMSNSDVNELNYTTTLMYSWDSSNVPIKVKIGDVVLSDNNYKEVGELSGESAVTVELTDPDNTSTFNGLPLTFYTKHTYEGKDYVAQATMYVSFTNNNRVDHGAIIDNTDDYNVFLYDDGSSVAPYYPLGSTVYFRVTYDEFKNAEDGVIAYINQAISRNGTIEKEPAYSISVSYVNGEYQNLSSERVGGQEIWKLHNYRMPDPGTSGYQRTFDLFYNNGSDFFMRLVFDIEPRDAFLDLDRYSVTFGPSDTSVQRVLAFSSSPVSFTNYFDWINCETVADKTYNISVLPYSETSDWRTGVIEYTNEDGLTRTLQVNQIANDRYIYAIPPSETPIQVNPGSQWSTVYNTADEFAFNFSVVSNISFNIYLDGDYRGSYSSTSGSLCSISLDIPANQSTQSVTHDIEVRSELDPIHLRLTIAGVVSDPDEEIPVIDDVFDNIFHKEDAFDILRTEKILTVACSDPDQIELDVSDTDLVAKIYEKTSDKLYIHCYPRTVRVWDSDKEVSLFINYKGRRIREQKFIIECTVSTVGTYFNVSSTIESFESSNTYDQTVTITGFSMAGTLTLETADYRSSPLRISDAEIIYSSEGSGYNYYKWVVTIPKGLFPAPGTPWTLELKNSCQIGTFSKYINIYEAHDVAWDDYSSFDFQFTAFGHLSIADGTEILPIVYSRRRMKSFIGTNEDSVSTGGQGFDVPYIIHDYVSRMSLEPAISGSSSINYWAFTPDQIRYSTCENCHQISSNTHNAVTVNLVGYSGRCTFSNSMDTNFYDSLGLAYTSVYGSEYIYEDTQDSSLSRYVLLPSSKTTINPICIQVSNPIKYMTNNNAPRFIPVPPDWKISTNFSSYMTDLVESSDGYLTIPDISEGEHETSFYYMVDSYTNYRPRKPKTTYPNGGKYIVNLLRSTLTVIDELPEVQPDEPGSQDEPISTEYVIYDQWDPNNNNILRWTGGDISFYTQNSDSQYQPSGTRYYFHSGYSLNSTYGYLTNVGLPTSGGVPVGARIVTDLNLTLNCANMNKGFNGTGTSSGEYSSTVFNFAKIYDLENSVVWDSQETYSGWDSLHSKDRRATFLTDGIGNTRLSVKSSRGLYLSFGMAGVCEPDGNYKAKYLMFVPYVCVVAQSPHSSSWIGTNYFFVKYGQRFGLGFTNVEASENQALVECAYQLTRTVVDPNNGYYKYNVKISSSSGLSYGGGKMPIPAEGAPNLLIDPSEMYSYRTNGTLDFEITHEDMCNIISYHVRNLDIVREDGLNDDTPWYFYGTDSGLDNSMGFYVQPYSFLRDLKVTVK